MVALNSDCTIYNTVDLISKRWTLLILLELHRGGGGKKRYTELKSGLFDISPKMLSERLRELEKAGMIAKTVDASRVPIRTDYELTDMGKDFMPVIRSLKGWALKWKGDNRVCSKVECADCSS